MRFDLADLRLFLCIVDAGSLTHGALGANLALASASERLRKMEEDAGIPLLERQPRGVVATQAGEAVAHHARLILQQQALLKGELQGFATGERGVLLLYANTAGLTDFLPPRLSRWLSSRPHINVELRERTSVEIVRGVSDGIIEAGIVSDSASAPDIQIKPIARDHLVLIAPAGHRLATEQVVRFGDILNEVFVGLASGNALHDHIQEQAYSLGLGRGLRMRIRMKTFDGLCAMVEQGIGLGILPQSVATRYEGRYSYHILVIQENWAQRQLCVTYRDWSKLTPAMQSLLTYLEAST